MALTLGADQVSVDATHEKDVQITTPMNSSRALVPADDRRVQIDTGLATVNAQLPDAATSDKVVFFVKRTDTAINAANITLTGADTIDGSDIGLTLQPYQWVEVMSDGTEWKVINKGTEINDPENVIIVNRLEDLPEASGGVITLDANYVYILYNFITIGTDQIDLNGALLWGNSASKAGITYTGTQSALISTNFNVNLQNLVITCTDPAGECFNLVSDGTHFCNFLTVVTALTGKIGTIDNFTQVGIVRCSFTNASDRGIVFNGVANDLISIRSCVFSNNAGIAIDFTSCTNLGIVNINLVNFIINITQTGISNVVDSTNVSDFFRMIFCDFSGLGTYIDTFTRCDPPVNFFGNIGNSGTENSTAKCGIFVEDGNEFVTAIAGLGIITPVLATTWTVSANNCKFSNPSAGQLQYDGSETLTLNVAYKALVDPSGGTNRGYETFIRKNGSILDLQSRDAVNADAATPTKAVGFTEIEMTTGDYIELVIQQVSNTVTDVTLSAISLTVSQ